MFSATRWPTSRLSGPSVMATGLSAPYSAFSNRNGSQFFAKNITAETISFGSKAHPFKLLFMLPQLSAFYVLRKLTTSGLTCYLARFQLQRAGRAAAREAAIRRESSFQLLHPPGRRPVHAQNPHAGTLRNHGVGAGGLERRAYHRRRV